MDRILTTLAFALFAGPAFAISTPVAVPEPASMTLFATAVAGAYIVRKLRIGK